ncbi:hypothetical protein L208DRAFT_1313974, partial [Tricholoma matsutake]
DLKQASAKETGRVPFSNPAVRALRSEITAVRSNVMGTDKSWTQIRSKIWSTMVMKGPPSLWIMLNPSDMHDPVAQVFAGQEINMDAFVVTDGPDATNRAITIATDPFTAAKFFHSTIALVLRALFGIDAGKGHKRIRRKEGIFSKIAAYIGTVKAQGVRVPLTSALHYHMLFCWYIVYTLSTCTVS